MSFLKSFLASCLGTLVTMIALCILLFVWIAALTREKEVQVEENSVLHLRLEVPISELELEDPLAEILPGAADQTVGLLQLKQAIRHAKDDPKIKGIYLNTSYLMTGMASLQEIRDAILDFRSGGKWVISYANFYTEGAYYLASAADKVYMNPEGEVELNGLAADVMFFKRLFDKLDIRPEVFRVGEFKSAVEPFIRENLSDENRLQLNSLLGSIYGEMLRHISDSRKIPYEKLKEISDKMMVRTPSQAVSYGLIDSLYYEDQLKDDLRERLGLAKGKEATLIRYARYKKSFVMPASSKNEIAVIVADGNIMPGKAEQGTVGAETICEQIRKARTNDRVKAIVMRINSPGGVFQSADQMWREISLAAKAKPVIASMSDYAASGGYYMAMACDTIVARPTTITGSIGVFSVLFDLSHFMGDKLGITSEEVKTGEIGELATVTRSLTEVEKDIWQKQTDRIYEVFTQKAADGRHMSQEDIKKIASGRVWTGSQAKDNGLADVIGGFDDAVRIAAVKAGVAEDYKLRYYPRPKPLLEKLMGEADEMQTRMLKARLGEQYGWYQQWEKVKGYQGMQMRMVEFTIK